MIRSLSKSNETFSDLKTINELQRYSVNVRLIVIFFNQKEVDIKTLFASLKKKT